MLLGSVLAPLLNVLSSLLFHEISAAVTSLNIVNSFICYMPHCFFVLTDFLFLA